MLTALAYILLTLVILDGLLLWLIAGRARNPVRRLVYNATAVAVAGVLIWLDA